MLPSNFVVKTDKKLPIQDGRGLFEGVLCRTSGFKATCTHQNQRSCSLELSLVFGKRLNKEWPWTDKVKVYLVRMADEETLTWDGPSEERTAWQVQKARVTISGKQFTQADDFSVTIDVIDNTRRIGKIRIDEGRKPGDKVSKGELTQLRSAIGSLAWIARQARPDLLYKVSYLETTVKAATVSTLKECNRVIDIAVGYSFSTTC